MKTLLITSPDKPDVEKEMTEEELSTLLVNTFGTDEEGVVNAMRMQAILLGGRCAIIGSTVWSIS